MSWWDDRAELTGTVAVVIGGAGGLGAAITADLAANGVRLAVIDRDEAAAVAIRAELGDAGFVHIGDGRDPATLEALFAEVDARWGRLDTLVNVVGGTFRAPFADTNPRGWDALLRTNLGYVLTACSLAIPRMRAGGRGGSIINLTTIEAHRAAPNFAVYSAAKAGVTQFARSLAVELAPEGIRVNNVAPDMTPTAGTEGIGMGSLRDPAAVRIAIPMGRLGVPSDVSNCVVFFASGLSKYVTGTTLHPDGGTMASSGWFNWPEEGFTPTVPASVLGR
ncbi:MAG: kduD [Pseudonocardiales bacterium]|nr:kduD [Pseudonocardiales bacterium]